MFNSTQIIVKTFKRRPGTAYSFPQCVVNFTKQSDRNYIFEASEQFRVGRLHYNII